jgi:hypothetical protein
MCIDLIMIRIWDRARQLWESGEYQMGRVRVFYFQIRSSEGGSPRLCRLTTDRLAPVSKFDYVLTHTRFMGSHKLSSFDGCWVRWYPTIPIGCHWDSVWANHGCPSRYHMEDMHLGTVGPVRLFDSRCELWLHMVSVWLTCVMFLPCKIKLARVSTALSDMSDTCLLLSFCSNTTSLCLI